MIEGDHFRLPIRHSKNSFDLLHEYLVIRQVVVGREEERNGRFRSTLAIGQAV
jgi:hypothetical protein